jgi:hypothetical protein
VGEIMNTNSKDKELIERGTKALIKELGYSGFIKYVSRIQASNGYFRSKEEVYRAIAIDKQILE